MKDNVPPGPGEAPLTTAGRQPARAQDVETEIIRLIVSTREKFPHSVAWEAALKRVLWRYTTPNSAPGKTRRPKAARKSES